MTRGKEELAALRRRNEGLEIACALANDQLADYKLRARQVEAAARQLPGLEAEVARLRQALELVTSPQVARLTRDNRALAEQNTALREKLRRVVKDWKKVVTRFTETHGGTNLEGMEELVQFVTDQPDAQIHDGPGISKYNAEALYRLDQARGNRRPPKAETKEEPTE